MDIYLRDQQYLKKKSEAGEKVHVRTNALRNQKVASPTELQQGEGVLRRHSRRIEVHGACIIVGAL